MSGPHGPAHDSHHTASGSIGVAFALNVSFTVVEIIGAWLTNSTAIAADAVHDLGDSFALAFAWWMERASQAEPTKKFTFGFGRLSAAGALVNTGVIVVGSLFILREAVPRLFDPPQADAEGMILLAILGVAVNGFAAWRAGDATMNASVVRWHLLEDLLGWVAVLIGAIVMRVADVPILDPLLSIAIAVFVSIGAVRHGRRAADVLLQAVPPNVDLAALHEALLADESVASIADLHVWSLDGSTHVSTIEVGLAEDLTLTALEPVRQRLRACLAKHGVVHTTLEFTFLPTVDERVPEAVPQGR
jgi:cobalt-zinc-cadmium efflux system protein